MRHAFQDYVYGITKTNRTVSVADGRTIKYVTNILVTQHRCMICSWPKDHPDHR